MKAIFITIISLIFSISMLHAQADTLYMMKAGVVINKQSIKSDKVDSIIFNKPYSPFTLTDTLYAMKAGAVINKQSIKFTDVDSLVFYKSGFLHPLGIQSVPIPAGSFTMGSPDAEVSRLTDETQFAVTLSAFRMSKYEITNAQFAAFLNAKSIGSDGLYAAGAYPTKVLIFASSGSTDWGLHYTAGQWVPVSGYDNFPVDNVSWYGAAEFATYVGATLPTDAQWEYACRAGTTTTFNTGSCLTNLQAHYDWSKPYSTCTNNTVSIAPGKTQAVGSYDANAWGLYDMHGNVGEWCADWYATTYSSTAPATGTYRVYRGGGYSSTAVVCRSAKRYAYSPQKTLSRLGFRVVFAP